MVDAGNVRRARRDAGGERDVVEALKAASSSAVAR
jgi:hypothetical protein